MKITYTHKGWFGLCPIYIGGHQGEAPDITARHEMLEWLLDLSAALMDAAMFCVAAMGGEPRGYRIHIGPKLEKPVVLEIDHD
jgi:hypothetical protein